MAAEIEKPKKKPSKIDQMTKEQIRQAIFKKRECNAKAQSIVVNLLETFVTESYFIKCLPDINQSHFEDVIEERALVYLCGYPLCSTTLFKKDIPKQMYRISLKTNKVYDIRARKNFCSNGCYKSAMHVKKQLLTSPLWFRQYEEIPKINLLPMNSAGSLGQEVDLKLVEKLDCNQEKQIYASINDFTRASLDEIGKSDTVKVSVTKNINNTINNASSVLNHSFKGNMQELSGSRSQPNYENIGNADLNKRENNKKSKKPNPNPFNIVGDIIERPERKIDPILVNKPKDEERKGNDPPKKVSKKKTSFSTILTIEVEKCLADWFTLDTLIFLYGREKVKQILADKGECIQEYLNNYASSTFHTSNTYDQYQALCRKLNKLEIEERKYDSQSLQRDTKPLPDYSMIQEESKKIQLKVKAFYSGEIEGIVPQPEVADEAALDDNESTIQFPLYMRSSIISLRRNIVCTNLDKALPDLLRSLKITHSIKKDIHLLVKTFQLRADNIMFKPTQWTFIVLILIKLLSLRDTKLDFLLGQPIVFQRMQLLLLSYKKDGGYMERLISWLTDIDRMLDDNDRQLTIE